MESGVAKYKNKCCVPGCSDKASKRHRFPNPKTEEEMMRKWVESIKNPKLKDMSPGRIYLACFVCERHFAAEYVVTGTRRGLRKDAIPTLCLSDISEEVEGLVVDAQVNATDSRHTMETMPVELDCGQQKTTDAMALQRSLATGASTSAAVQCLPKAAGGKTDNGKTVVECCSQTGASTTVLRCPPAVRAKMEFKEAVPRDVSTAQRLRPKRRGILHQVDVTRQKDLTPRCKKFYNMTLDWCRKTAKLQYRIGSLQTRLANAEKVSQCPNFANLLDYVSPTTYTFIMQQIRNQQFTPRARRFTMDEKILSLTLLKASSKGYRLLAKIFCLPSVKTLTNLLNKILVKPGLNQHILDSLKRTVAKLQNENDKKCAVVFDEMSITPSLFYSQNQDSIVGLEDFGDARTTRIANYANVFLIKGINRQWKQPLAFTFSHGPTKSVRLKKMIGAVIRACQKVGLHVVATICDQGSSNRAAINSLRQETDARCKSARVENPYFGFVINGHEVVPLFDVPHLFKGIRNNLLKHALLFEQDGVQKVARWGHVEQLYLLDTNDETRLCPSLTDAHVYPCKMNKMKVALMAQVFSYRVGALMKRVAQWQVQQEYTVPREAEQTADFILFMDTLFDSLNGNSLHAPGTKPLKGGVTSTSAHVVYWGRAIKIIESMRFWNPKNNRYVQVPSTINLIRTIKGFIYLSSKLLGPMKYILPRALNQDCLENFFAAMRTHGRRNTSPDAVHFVSSFKALLVNNFLSVHSAGANCEADNHTGALDDLRSFITGEAIAGVRSLGSPVDDIPGNIHAVKRTPVASATIAYFAGFVGRRVLKKNKQCPRCKQLLTYSDGAVPLDVIEAREYRGAALFRPGSYLYFLCCQCLPVLFYLIPRHCTLQSLGTVLRSTLTTRLTFNVLNCEEHANVGSLTCHLIVQAILFFWCKQINRVLKGHDEKFVRLLKSKRQQAIDPMKLHAHNIYLKTRKLKRPKRNNQ